MRLIGSITIIVLMLAGSALGRTWRVEQDCSGEFTTIQPAIDAAADGDTITIGAGWYQETNDYYIPEFSQSVAVTAYWNDGRELTIVGVGRDDVKIGPESYQIAGPVAILAINSTVVVSGIAFENSVYGVLVFGDAIVSDCEFVDEYKGISINNSASSIVQYCSFVEDFGSGESLNFYNSTNITVTGCEFASTGVRFDHISGFSITDCKIETLGHVYATGADGEIVSCDFISGGTVVDSGGEVVIRNSKFLGGDYNISLIDPYTKVELYDNEFIGGTYYGLLLRSYPSVVGAGNKFSLGNAPYFVKVDGYGSTWPYTLDLRNNDWGVYTAEEIDELIYDANDTSATPAVVLYSPFTGMPVPNEPTSWGSVKAMFR